MYTELYRFKSFLLLSYSQRLFKKKGWPVLIPSMNLFPNYFDILIQVDAANDTHFTGNDVCPVGYYCPNGTDYPFPCPRGTFSNVEEVTSEDGCELCPPGRYCNVSAYTVATEAPMCDPGLVY